MHWLRIYVIKRVGEVISEEYILEYGTDCLEMHIGAVQPGERALVVDDLIATGGTLCAAIKLLGMCFINLNFMSNRSISFVIEEHGFVKTTMLD